MSLQSLYSWQFWLVVIPSVAGVSSLISVLPSLLRPPYSTRKTFERLMAALSFFLVLVAVLAVGVSVSLGLYFLERQSMELIKHRPMDLRNKMTGQISSSWDLPMILLVLTMWVVRWITMLATAAAPIALLGAAFQGEQLFSKSKADEPMPMTPKSEKRTCRSCGQKTPKNIARCYHCGEYIS